MREGTDLRLKRGNAVEAGLCVVNRRQAALGNLRGGIDNGKGEQVWHDEV
jgi:hypothetical protein